MRISDWSSDVCSSDLLDSGYFMQIAPMVPMLDPNYVNEFWTTPGYLGHDPASGLADMRFTFDTTVSAVTPGFPPLFELSAVPARDFSNAHLILIDADSAGSSLSTSEGCRAGQQVVSLLST